jgi:AcrR family transcriptional regulator
MPSNRPTLDELLEAVVEFLEKRLMPKLDKHTAFHARVAANVLNIVRRELEQGPGLDAEELARLKDLLGEDGTLEELNAQLCNRIRRGDLDHRNPDLMEHLFLTTLGKVSVDQPIYSAYRRALEETEGS